MNSHLKGFIVVLIVGVSLILGVRYALPMLRDQLQRDSSDSSNVRGVLNIGTDNWIGYFPLCSPEMQRRLHESGYTLNCIDDGADYAKRFKELKKGKLQFAVATVDSWLLNGKKANYPGIIASVIDESKGGDAMVARKSVVADLNALKSLAPPPRIAYTPDSPSEHLLKAVSSHFDLPFFRGNDNNWRLKSDGSSEALKALLKSKVDVAVLWEPDVSRALAETGIIKLIGSGDTDKLIVDILLVERHFANEQPEAVEALLQSYFATLNHYHLNHRDLVRDVAGETSLAVDQIEAMLQGVAWATLNENSSDWFNARGQNPGIIDAINISMDILLQHGDFSSNPLPAGDPYRLTNRQFISALYARHTGIEAGAEREHGPRFAPLSDQQWKQLKAVGTLKVEPVNFRRSTAHLDDGGRSVIRKIAGKLDRYPNFRVLIEGHTGIRGDASANLSLSATRARAVMQQLISTYQVDPQRLRAVGYGSSRPLKRQQGESDRRYGYRLPRVEITLLSEAY